MECRPIYDFQDNVFTTTQFVGIEFSHPGLFWAPEWAQTPMKGVLYIKYTQLIYSWSLFYPHLTRNEGFRAIFHKFGVLKRQYGDLAPLKKNSGHYPLGSTSLQAVN